ncbi:hypothetical protein QYE76_027240 [Lolium multiflorum]|uniref:Uncharacterized protein n=1 Tax=Lolium multiflorum TaxID=4521 RepID=A0AAD8Q6D7_LOLMU|nr:hypothetical protein QYE76_027240 [Lolium multiflorum]
MASSTITTTTHFWIAISMVFLLAATSLMLLKLCGDAVTLGWWDLFINFGISQCFAFLVCARWSNPMDIGGPVLIIPILIFQVLLCMRLEGTPSNARFIPVRAILFRLIAWSIDEHSKEEEAHLCYTNNIGYVRASCWKRLVLRPCVLRWQCQGISPHPDNNLEPYGRSSTSGGRSRSCKAMEVH